MSTVWSRSAATVATRLRYPFWWQFFAWYLVTPRFGRATNPRNPSPCFEVAGGPLRIFVVVDLFLEGLGVEGGAYRERQDLLTSLREVVNVTIVGVHDASISGRVTPASLARLCKELNATHIVIVDLAAVRARRKGLLRSIRELDRALEDIKVVPVVVLWDLLNPIFTLGAKWLVRNPGHVLVMPNTSGEAEHVGLPNGFGPCADLISGTAASADGEEIKYSERQNDVFLPPALAGYRASYVKPIREAADAVGLRVSGGWFDSYADYVAAIANARVCVVVNVVKDDYLRGPIPRRSRETFPNTNMVARNFEALSLGSVLLAQDTPALRCYLRPFVDYVPWRTVNEAIDRLRWLMDNPDVAARIAASGRCVAVEVTRQRASWNVFATTPATGELFEVD